MNRKLNTDCHLNYHNQIVGLVEVSGSHIC